MEEPYKRKIKLKFSVGLDSNRPIISVYGYLNRRYHTIKPSKKTNCWKLKQKHCLNFLSMGLEFDEIECIYDVSEVIKYLNRLGLTDTAIRKLFDFPETENVKSLLKPVTNPANSLSVEDYNTFRKKLYIYTKIKIIGSASNEIPSLSNIETYKSSL